MFLSRNELAELVGCRPESRACMRRWLVRHNWPFEVDRNGLPKVARAYYDARMAGHAPEPRREAADEPDFSAFGVGT